ncbi:hypothetical protein CYY_002187 [Polysphondylium violaceum]|uniref:FZ domain-containing protein n=1 Tax=Polysphondylium violaceum TaxID=133409 RepID=A0A8J4Q208_9MYCE|nr:hypothetical protein CYY_002187 [Polysphondylium violaceum]
MSFTFIYILLSLLLIIHISYGQNGGGDEMFVFNVTSKGDFRICPLSVGDLVRINATQMFQGPGENVGTYLIGQNIELDNKTVQVFHFENQPVDYAMDSYIEFVINQTKKVPGFSNQCIEQLVTYLCTYRYVKYGYEPCNTICDSFEKECPNTLMVDEAGTGLKFNVVPTVTSCLEHGVTEVNTTMCSSASVLGRFNFTDTMPLTKTNVIKYPGGQTKGTILGFGVLVGVLLIIFGLDLIMRFQQKK